MEERTLYLFPDAVRPWLENVATADTVIVEHISFEEHL